MLRLRLQAHSFTQAANDYGTAHRDESCCCRSLHAAISSVIEAKSVGSIMSFRSSCSPRLRTSRRAVRLCLFEAFAIGFVVTRRSVVRLPRVEWRSSSSACRSFRGPT